MDETPLLVWFRRDLRLDDNPSLVRAVSRGKPVIPVFIWAPEEEGKWAPGEASRWWLHHSLKMLDAGLRKRGSRLVIRQGNSLNELRSLARRSGAGEVFWSRCYEPAAKARDAEIEKALSSAGLRAGIFGSSLFFEPREIKTKSGGPFQVFTPFLRACLSSPEPRLPVSAPRKIPAPRKWPESIPLRSLGLLPRLAWAKGLKKVWAPGEKNARILLGRFLRGGLSCYAGERDVPAVSGTSRLSAHIHFGEIGPRRIWHEVLRRAAMHRGPDMPKTAEIYLRQLLWREFAHHLLCHFPATAELPLREKFNGFRWRNDKNALKKWQKGLTGYPVVDAGMRQLWETGWMHNRVRMIAASFLVKDLLVSWQEGAKWFWETLVDADLANNTMGWQWCAGCGADAAPFFRIFNPVLQGEKFDPEGEYVKHWVPELKHVPAAWVHKPWLAPADVLKKAGLELGKSYPRPIISHDSARQRALAAYSRT